MLLNGTGADADGAVSYSWSSDCAGASFDDSTLAAPTLTIDVASADLGPCEVTLEVSDDQGTTTSCTATVEVVDTTSPTPVCQDSSVQLDGSGEASITASDVDNGSSDACDQSPTLSVDVSTFGCSDLGAAVPVELTVVDASGNSDSCTALVTVEDPLGACGSSGPTAVCMDGMVELNGDGLATISPALVDGGSTFGSGGPATSNSLVVTPDTFNCTHLGANTVTLVATDSTGQTAMCTATVTVVDATAPLITCPVDPTVECTDPAGEVVTFSASATDACSTPTVTCIPASGSTFPIGTTEVTCTADDGNGNTSSCTFDVIVGDTNPPVALCSDISVTLDEVTAEVTISASDVDGGSSDACGNVTLAVDKSVFTCEDVGVNSVTLTVTDESGNSSSCIALVTVDGGLANCDDPEPVTNQVPGDCDQNGRVGVGDGLCMIRGMFWRRRSLPCGNGRKRDPGNIRLLDWQGDGRLRPSDVTSLFRFLFRHKRPHHLSVPGMERTGCVRIEGCPDTLNCLP